MKLGRFRLCTRRTICDLQARPYLRRWTLIETPWFELNVHHILRSDDDRHLHDHPWPFVSLIVSGGYLEHLDPPTGSTLTLFRWREAGTLVWHRAEDLHRIELPAGQTAWTVVLCGRRRREWGFLTNFGWMPWRKYLTFRRRQFMDVTSTERNDGAIA